MRRRGVRRSPRDIANDLGVFGGLELHRISGVLTLQVAAPGGHVAGRNLYYPLYEAVCVSMGECLSTWRGWQRDGNQDDPSRPSYVQEWLVEHIAMRAPADAYPFSMAIAGGKQPILKA